MSSSVLYLSFINEKLVEESIPLIFDNDINAFRGCIARNNFRFPVLTNLVKLQRSFGEDKPSFELIFSYDTKDFVRIFVYEQHQKMCSRHKSILLNESVIYDLLYKNECDEALLYFNGNEFDFIFHTNNVNNSNFYKLWLCISSLPAKMFYLVLLCYKLYTVWFWLLSMFQ